jgi:hypothetical protein
MNINYKFCTKIALILLGASPLFWNSNPAHAISGNLALDNGSFLIAPSNTGVTTAPGSSNIDNSTTIPSFGDKFSDSGTFLLLGTNNPAGSTIQGSGGVNSSGTSPTFELTSSNISRGLDLSFDWAFQGNSGTGGPNNVYGTTNADSFRVFIANPDLDETVLAFQQSAYGSGSFNDTVDISSLTPGNDYSVYVSLTEAAGLGNSAAGFDNIGVGVPFEFSPSLGLLMMGGLFGGHTYLKRRKLAANAKFD